jgi:pimeloyl-ACP methyl ester carboxylesterase
VSRPESVLGGAFVSATAQVNGTAMHYVRGGRGPGLVLLHGFPQDWFEWRHVMPRLARRFTVVALDLRGVGGSAPGAGGFSAAELASDVKLLAEQLDLGPVHLAGHDIGGCVAYAFAREFPEWTRSVAVLEVPIPGIGPELRPEAAALWHVPFHLTSNLPEALVAGRQETYFRYFFDQFTSDNTVISDADVRHYADSYRTPDQLRSGFEFYRAMPANESYNARHTEPIDVPLLLVGGEHLFGPVLRRTAQCLRADHGWSRVDVHVVANAKHYLVEERPDEVAEVIERHIAGASERESVLQES